MKRFWYIGVLFVIAMLFSGCGLSNIEKPERFGIKTSDEAVYKLAIAQKSFDLGEQFSFDSFLKEDNSNGEGNGGEENEKKQSYKIYEYNPSSNQDKIKWLLLKMNIQEVPLNPSDYTDSMTADIKVSINDDEDSQENNQGNEEKEDKPLVSETIKIPEITNSEVTQNIDLDINTKINNLVVISGQTKAEAAVEFLAVNDTDGFTSIKYKSGFMIIQPSVTESNTITGKIILKKGNETLKEATFENGQAKLPLDNVEIVKAGLTFEFTESRGVSFTGTVDADSVVEEATGLTIKEPIPFTASSTKDGNSNGIKIGNQLGEDQSNLKSYKIGEGTLSVTMELPSDWTENGVSCEYDMDLTGKIEGQLSETKTSLPLNGKEFDNTEEDSNTFNYDVAGKIFLNNASVTLYEKDSEGVLVPKNPAVKVVVDVKKISEAVIILKENEKDYGATIDKNIDLNTQEGNLKNVRKMQWSEYGLRVSYKNTLPAANKIFVSLKSFFFQLQKNDIVLEAEDISLSQNKEELKTFEISEFINKSDENYTYVTEFGEGHFTAVDIDADVVFEGFKKEGNVREFTAKDIVPGETYTIEMNVTPVLEWEKMWISTEDMRKNETTDTGMNLSSIFNSMEESVGSDVAKNLAFKRMPLYLIAEVPEMSTGSFFDTVDFKGVVKAYIGDSEKQYLLGSYNSDEEKEETGILNITKSLTLETDENGVVTTDIELEMGEGKDMAELLNDKTGGSLCVSYNIGFSSKDGDSADDYINEVTKEEVQKMQGTEGNGETTLSISAIGIIPLEFTVKDDINMDILKLIRKDEEEEQKDLLGRKDSSDYEKYKKYIDLFSYVKIRYEPSKLPFRFVPDFGTGSTGNEMSLEVDFDGETGALEPKILDITGDSLTVGSNELLTYPLTPSVKLVIPKGTLKIPQTAVFDTKLYLEIATSGEVFWLDKTKSNNEGGND